MGGIGDLFSGISIFYLFIAAFTLYQLVTQRREFWSDEYVHHPRVQQLAGGVAFFLLAPISVLLHEYGHMAAAWSTGSTVLGLHYFIYWGYVEYIPSSSSPLLEWYVALAGNFVSYALAVVCLAIGLLAKIKPILRVVMYQFGLIGIAQTLIFYPLISLDPSFHGDWDTIYSFEAPVASGITLAVHLLSLIGLVWVVRRRPNMVSE